MNDRKARTYHNSKQISDKIQMYVKELFKGLNYKNQIVEIEIDSIISQVKKIQNKYDKELFDLLDLSIKLNYQHKILPKISCFLKAKNNVSPIHKFIFSNPKNLNSEKLNELVNCLTEKVLLLKNLKKDESFDNFYNNLLKSTLKYLRVLIIITIGDQKMFDNIISYFDKIIADYKKEIKGNSKISISFRKTIYLILLSNNYLSFYNKIFNNKEDNNLSFENNTFNESLYDYIFNEINKAEICFHNREFLELILSEYDGFSNSIKQLSQFKDLGFIIENKNLIRENPKNLLEQLNLKTNFDLIENQVNLFINYLTKFEKSRFTIEKEIINYSNSIYDLINDSLKDKENKKKIQLVLFKRDIVNELINLIVFFDSNFEEIKEKEILIKSKTIIFNCLYKLVEDNIFLIPLYFNKGIYKRLLKEEIPSIENLNFYNHLMEELIKFNYKIDTIDLLQKISFSKIEGLIPSSDKLIVDKFIPKKSIFEMSVIPEESIENILKNEPEIISHYLIIYKKLIDISNKHSILLVNQTLVNNLIILYQIQDFDLKKDMEKENMKDFYKNLIKLINKLESSFFQKAMHLIDINFIENIIKDKINEEKKYIQYEEINIFSEIILFYFKYHFQSISYWSEFKLMNTSLRIIEKEKIDLFIETINLSRNYIDEIDDINNNKNNINKIHDLFSFFCKGVCIPLYLILWKITYYTLLTGEEKYEVYSLVFLFLQSYKDLIAKIEELKNKDEETKSLYDFIQNKFFIEELQITDVKLILDDKINQEKNSNLDILNVKKWVNLFMSLIKNFKFYDNIKNYYEQIEEEMNEEKKENENKNKNKSEIDLILERLDNYYEYYTSNKMDNSKNIIMKYFHEGNEKLYETKVTKIFKTIIYHFNESLTYEKIYPINYSFSLEENFKIETKNDIESKILNNNVIKFQNNFMLYSNKLIIEVGHRIFMYNPKLFQNLLVKYYEFGKSIIIPLISYQIYYLIQSFLFSMGEIFPISKENLNILINSLDFLRLLCEDHNPLFQTIYFGNYITKGLYQNFNFIKLIYSSSYNILKIFTHFQKQKFYVENLSFITPYKYLLELEIELNEFKIELIQGTSQNNLENIQKFNYFYNFIESYFEFSDLILIDQIFANLFANFLKFINCFIDECLLYSNTDISIITNELPILKLILKAESSFLFLLSKFQIKINDEVQLFRIFKDESNKEINREELQRKFDTLRENLYEHYDDLVESPYFKISFMIFIHLVQISESNNEKKIYYMNNLEELKINNYNDLGPNSNFIGKLYYDLCKDLMVKNEVVYYKEYKQWKGLSELYAKLIPEGGIANQSLKYKSYIKIIDDDGTLTLKGTFINEINSILNPENNNNDNEGLRILIYFLRDKKTLLILGRDVSTFLSKTDYNDAYIKLVRIINYYDELNYLSLLREKYRSQPKIAYLSELKFDELEYYNVVLLIIPNFLLIFVSPFNYVDTFIFYYVILQLIFLFLIILDFLYFKYIKLRDIIGIKDISIWKMSEYLSDGTILPFVWTFFFGLLSLKYRFFLSCQLFTVFTISQTMKSVLEAIQHRYKQFFATAFLLIILILFYAALTLYFFNINDDGSILCNSYLECFLYLFNNGMRQGGLNFEIKINSQSGFYGEFIYSWIFYFLIILIILNIVNGIIVDTFQEIRENNEAYNTEILNTCYICQLKSTDFEGKDISFEGHLLEVHNLFDYFFYLFKIHNTDPHDLNSVDFQVYNCIKNEKITFFPINKEEEED